MEYRERVIDSDNDSHSYKACLIGLVLIPIVVLVSIVIYGLIVINTIEDTYDKTVGVIVVGEIFMLILLMICGFKANEEYIKIKKRSKIREIYNNEVNKFSNDLHDPSARCQANIELNIEKIANDSRSLRNNIVIFFTIISVMNGLTSDPLVKTVLALLVGVLYVVLHIVAILDKTNKIETIIRQTAQKE